MLKISLSNVKLSGGDKIEIADNDIVILTGPNNSGKTTFLQNINTYFDGRHRTNSLGGLVVDSADLRIDGTEADYINFCKEAFEYDKDEDRIDFRSYGKGLKIDTLIERFRNGEIDENVLSLRSLRLNAHDRLGGGGFKDGLDQAAEELFADLETEKEISSIFKRAFSTDLILDRTRQNSQFKIGDRLKLPKGDKLFTAAARRSFDELNRVSTQGDGMRSFARMLLAIKTGSKDVIMIDEPELFLHPPQIRELAHVLTRDAPPRTQFFIATHSETFVRALLDHSSPRVNLVRLRRAKSGSVGNHLNSAAVKEMWRDPNIGASGIMGSLFGNVSVLCEGDSDVRFLTAMRNEMGSDVSRIGEIYHCGGKSKIPQIGMALRRLGVSLIAVLDIDCMSERSFLRQLVESFGGDFSAIEKDHQTVKSYVDNKRTSVSGDYFSSEILKVLDECKGQLAVPTTASNRIHGLLKRVSPWGEIKAQGVAFFSGQAFQAVNEILTYCRSLGIYILPQGELEGLCLTSSRNSKSAWLQETLAKDLLRDPNLADARSTLGELAKIAGALEG